MMSERCDGLGFGKSRHSKVEGGYSASVQNSVG